MLDMAKLERRWLKYKIKNLLPYGLLLIAIILLGFLIPMMISKTSSAVSSPNAIENKSIALKASKPAKIIDDEHRMILEPSMQFIQSIDPSVIQAQDTSTVSTSSVPVKSTLSINTPSKALLSDSPPVRLPPKRIPVPTDERPTQPLLKNTLTSIKRDDAAFDIHEIEERFKNNSNPNLGLYIAHYHYDHGNYAEAYNYALKTNAINSTMEDSWLIFAKSLVKLGKVDQAKKTLQLYISNSNSQNAKNYLDTLNKETSK